MEESILQTNKFFGGLNPNASNVVLTQGELDPRRTLGHPLLHPRSNTLVIVMPCNISFETVDFFKPSFIFS